MLRSLTSAITGLRAHQLQMDVVGNNLANVNTPGFKSSLTRFSEVLAQTSKGPSGTTADRGSVPGTQVGLGVSVGAVNKVFTQGPILETGRDTDFAIQGNGFFLLSRDASNIDRVYTRDGGFTLSSDGSIVNPLGARLLGWNSASDGTINTSNQVEALKINIGQTLTLQETTGLSLRGNLDGSAVAATVVNSAIYIFDSKGGQHTVPITLTKSATVNQWTVGVGAITDPQIAAVTPVFTGAAATVAFNPDGSYNAGATTFTGFNVTYVPAAGLSDQVGAGPGVPGIAADVTGLQQVSGSSEVNQSLQDGFGPGTLTSFSLSSNGELQGIFTNGRNVRLGIVAIANFAASDGLIQVGGNAYVASPASGEPVVGQAGQGGHGTTRGQALEGSNTDLAQEFTLMITAQRGFQANARSITTADQMLQELADLKR